MTRIYTTQISETECIGDSLDKINGNSLNLDTAIQGLSSNALNTTTLLQTTSSTLATSITNKQPLITANDTNTIDLTLTTGNSPVLTGSVKNDSIRYSNLTSWQSVSGTSLSAEAVQPRLAKAWVNFNGAVTVPTISSAFNVSSITDIGTGQYQINFITPMNNTAYCVNITGTHPSVVGAINACAIGFESQTSTAGQIKYKTVNGVEISFSDNGANQYLDVFTGNVLIFSL